MGWRAAAMTLLCPVMVQRARASTHCPKQGPSCSHCHSSCHDTDNKAFCEVSCVQGYHAETTWKNGVHENAYQCLNGDWVAYKDGVSGPDCQPDAGWCAGYNPTGLGVQIDDPNCARDYGQKCSVNCGETFRPAGLPGHRIASRDYVCGTEHQWAPVVGGHDLQCVKVCPVDPEENAAFASHCTHDVDEECIARCDPGYASDSSLSTLAYVCNGNGEWMPARDGARLNCSLSGCPMFRIENAHHCPANDVGSTCEVSCEAGYTASVASALFECAADGKWIPSNSTNGELECKPIREFCDGNPRDESGYGQNIVMPSYYMSPSGEIKTCSREIEDICEATCANGTAQVAKSDPSYKCVSNGTRKDHGKWVAELGNPLECINLCPIEAAPVPNVRFSASCAESAKSPKAACFAVCKPGYRRTGGTGDYKCDGHTAKWTSFPDSSSGLVCAKICEADHRPNKTDVGQCIPCPTGFHSAGDSDECIGCHGNDKWSAQVGECTPKSASTIDAAFQIFQNESQGLQILELVVGTMATVATLSLCYGWCCANPLQSRAYTEMAGVLRDSFIGEDKLPARQLTALDVPARWMNAAKAKQMMSGWSHGTNSSSLQHTGSGGSGLSRRLAKNSNNVIHVMFTSEHVCELQPPRWMNRCLGSGSYGVVYQASWRGRNVAVKALKLPERKLNLTPAAEAKLKQKVEDVLFDFVAEIEVCADLNHPNLVRLLGYADKPCLFIVQELCEGGSLDQHLYVEGWRPTPSQVLKVAYDIALGIEHLHTAYNAPDNVHAQPIIHRDLKSPNLLLVAPPESDNELLVKVTDFGLSRDKGLDSDNYSQTLMMTGCGSVLWMAPEILKGKTYNEKVDVYSFAMCIVELIDCRLPWSGLARGAEVPNQVTEGHRPTKQLEGAADRPVETRLCQLVIECWDQTSSERPDFTTIVLRLEEMMGTVSSNDARHGRDISLLTAGSRSELKSIPEGLSRPVSPGSGPELEPEPELSVELQRADGASTTISDSKFRLPQRRTMLSGITRLGAPRTGCSLSASGVLAVLWFSTPGAVLLGALMTSTRTTIEDEVNSDLISVCLVYCGISCLSPFPIIKVVLSLLRRIRNEDDDLLLRRESASSATVENMRREYLAHAGIFGLIKFAFGVLNMIGQVLLMVELHRADEHLLFSVVLCSSVSTIVTSLPLALCILHEIAREMQRDFFTEVMESPHVPWVVLFSTSRIESLSILRLRMCSHRPCASFPMKPKHFYFIQSIGAYQFFIKDVPHVLVAFARLHALPGEHTKPRDVTYCSEWTLEMLCRAGNDLLVWSPWFALAFGSLHFAVIFLDGILRAMAWFSLTDEDGAKTLFVQTGLAHRVAEVLQPRHDIDVSYEHVENGENGGTGQGLGEMMLRASAAAKDYVAKVGTQQAPSADALLTERLLVGSE